MLGESHLGQSTYQRRHVISLSKSTEQDITKYFPRRMNMLIAVTIKENDKNFRLELLG